MLAPTRPTHSRLNNFHGTKKKLIGHHAGSAAPAWRNAAPTTPGALKGKQAAQTGSRIFISNLPLDVADKEVEELFKKTVGPLKDVFLVCNSQGRSKGMAVVTFVRIGDAAVARMKYNGKIVDGRRPIKIEIIVDADSPSGPVTSTPPSLFTRIASSPNDGSKVPQGRTTAKNAPVALSTRTNQSATPVSIPPKRRVKKGPRRVNKRQPLASKTKEDLDKEMDDYKAAVL